MVRSASGRGCSSFNEAAGIPRGRRATGSRYPWRIARFNEAAGIPRGRHVLDQVRPGPIGASMRPRVFPAEDADLPRALLDRVDHASMRPRVFPAEDGVETWDVRQAEHASMRPRVFPAEDAAAMSAIRAILALQ